MDALFRKHDRLLANTSMDIIREMMDKIHWNAQIISIMGVSNIRKIQALVKLIAEEVPFELNANKLAGFLEIGRDTVVEYLKYLGDAKVDSKYTSLDAWVPVLTNRNGNHRNCAVCD